MFILKFWHTQMSEIKGIIVSLVLLKMRWSIFIITLVLLPTCLSLDSKTEDYIYREERLLHAQKFNQSCEHEGQCSDHRLTCEVEEHTNEKRCLCVKYHSYDVYSQQCLVADNMTEVLAQLFEQYDAQAEEAEKAQKVFLGMLIAGIMVLGIGLIVAGLCTIIACFPPNDEVDYVHMWNHQQSPNNQPSTSGNQRAVSPRRDGVVDYIPGVTDMTASL